MDHFSYLNRSECVNLSAAQIPVTLICGFLGSGKTTLVNAILRAQHQPRIVVVVNEFGDVDIDGHLVLHADDNVIALSNGCICCTVRNDLCSTLHQLLIQRRQAVGAMAFDRILIEASGLASPGPTVQAILADPFLSSQLVWGAGLSMAHAQHIIRQLRDHPEASEQIAYADHILLNHCDRCALEDLDLAEAAVRSCNPSAVVQRTSHAQVDVLALLATRTWDTVDEGFGRNTVRHDDASTAHTHGVSALSLASAQPVDLDRLQAWLRGLLDHPNMDIMRIKGLVQCPQHREAVIVQGVYQWLEMRLGEQGESPESILVVIGRDLDRDAIRRGWAGCA